MKFTLPAQQSVGVGDLERIDDVAAVLGALERAGGRELLDGLSGGQARSGCSSPTASTVHTAELMARAGLYAELYGLQASGFASS